MGTTFKYKTTQKRAQAPPSAPTRNPQPPAAATQGTPPAPRAPWGLGPARDPVGDPHPQHVGPRAREGRGYRGLEARPSRRGAGSAGAGAAPGLSQEAPSPAESRAPRRTPARGPPSLCDGASQLRGRWATQSRPHALRGFVRMRARPRRAPKHPPPTRRGNNNPKSEVPGGRPGWRDAPRPVGSGEDPPRRPPPPARRLLPVADHRAPHPRAPAPRVADVPKTKTSPGRDGRGGASPSGGREGGWRKLVRGRSRARAGPHLPSVPGCRGRRGRSELRSASGCRYRRLPAPSASPPNAVIGRVAAALGSRSCRAPLHSRSCAPPRPRRPRPAPRRPAPFPSRDGKPRQRGQRGSNCQPRPGPPTTTPRPLSSGSPSPPRPPPPKVAGPSQLSSGIGARNSLPR